MWANIVQVQLIKHARNQEILSPENLLRLKKQILIPCSVKQAIPSAVSPEVWLQFISAPAWSRYSTISGEFLITARWRGGNVSPQNILTLAPRWIKYFAICISVFSISDIYRDWPANPTRTFCKRVQGCSLSDSIDIPWTSAPAVTRSSTIFNEAFRSPVKD